MRKWKITSSHQTNDLEEMYKDKLGEALFDVKLMMSFNFILQSHCFSIFIDDINIIFTILKLIF